MQDLDGTGKIRYTEYLAATIEAQGAISEERLAECFDRLDSDDSGYIDADNLLEMLGEEFPKDEIHAIIDEADITRDNRISYSEFLALWEEKNEQRRESLFEEIQVPTSSSSMHSVMSAVTEESEIDTSGSSNSLEEVEYNASTDTESAIARANFVEEKLSSVRKANILEADRDLGKKLFGGSKDEEIIVEQVQATEADVPPKYADI